MSEATEALIKLIQEYEPLTANDTDDMAAEIICTKSIPRSVKLAGLTYLLNTARKIGQIA
jgi:hypothetical protein